MFNTLIPLKCDVQHYPWGGCGADGQSPYIAELTGADAADGQPFAELWIGAHPKLPARAAVAGQDIPLDKLIAGNQKDILGQCVLDAGFDSLPFLLKVLDCDQPLSIQAHPDLERAAILHQRDPEHYPDANHKPEIAIGITGMTAFCQFCPAAEIMGHIDRLPALAAFLGTAGEDEEATSKEWLRKLYARIFAASDDEVAETIAALRSQIEAAGSNDPADEWFMKLDTFYPGDRGMLSAFFLNIVQLGAGQGVFLGPNEPHAYLDGTIVECMASSDNVVRAGLTPKFIDRDVLVDMITCTMGRPKMDSGEHSAPGETIYRVPTPEFQVESYVNSEGKVADYSSDGAVSIMLILSGSAVLRTPQGEVQAPRGSTWLWPAALDSCSIEFCQKDTQIIRARPNMAMMRGV